MIECCAVDQDTNEQVLRVMASRNSVAVQTSSGKVRNTHL